MPSAEEWQKFFRDLPITRSDEDKHERVELFKRLDRSQNGRLKYAELEAGICSILSTSAQAQRHHLVPVRAAFGAARQLASGHPGGVTEGIMFKEFRMLLVYLQRYVDLWDFFNELDETSDKRISFGEFKSVLPRLREWGLRDADEVIEDPWQAFLQIDQENTGSIDFHEFADWCMRHGLANHADDADFQIPLPRLKAVEAVEPVGAVDAGFEKEAGIEERREFEPHAVPEAPDLNNDGVPDFLQIKQVTDFNNDGIPDNMMISVTDLNNDGVPDFLQAQSPHGTPLPQGPVTYTPSQPPGPASVWHGMLGQMSPAQGAPSPWQGFPAFSNQTQMMAGQAMPQQMGLPGYPSQMHGGRFSPGQLMPQQPFPGQMPHMMPRPAMPGHMLAPPRAGDSMQVEALRSTVNELMNTVQTLQQTMACMPTQMERVTDQDSGALPARKPHRRRPRTMEASPGGDSRADVDSEASNAVSWNWQDMNMRDRDGRTALQLAAARGLPRLTSALLTNHFFTKVDAADVCGWTALHCAALSGKVQVCKAILDHPRFTEANAKDRVGDTVLHHAATRGYDDLCEALLGHPRFGKANAQNSHGWTALHSAAGAGHPTTCMVIMDHRRFQKADSANMFGSTALHCAARNGHSEVCNALLGHLNFTKAISQRDCVGRTALHWAALEEHPEACSTLVLHPRFFDADAKDRDGCTALDLARGGARRALLEAQMVLEGKVEPFHSLHGAYGAYGVDLYGVPADAYGMLPSAYGAYHAPPDVYGMFPSALGVAAAGSHPAAMAPAISSSQNVALTIKRHVYHARGGAPPYRGDYLTATDSITLDPDRILSEQQAVMVPPDGMDGAQKEAKLQLLLAEQEAPKKWVGIYESGKPDLLVDLRKTAHQVFGRPPVQYALVVIVPMKGMD